MYFGYVSFALCVSTLNLKTLRQASHNPLLTGERPYIPCNIVAPADGLHPVYRAGIEPHQVSWTLDEAIDGHVGLIQVLQVGPPWAHQEVDVIPECEGGKTTLWSRDLLHRDV